MARGRLVLRPDNLADIKHTLASCFDKHARVRSYETVLRQAADGVHLTGGTTASGTYHASVPVGARYLDHFAGMRGGAGVPPPLSPRQRRLPACGAEIQPRCD